jgi:hypothetical protein
MCEGERGAVRARIVRELERLRDEQSCARSSSWPESICARTIISGLAETPG